MKLDTAIDALHRATGIASADIQAVMTELSHRGIAGGYERELSSQDAALLYLRTAVPHLDIETFVSNIAGSELSGAKVFDDDGNGFHLTAEELSRNTYTQNLWGMSLSDCIDEHIEALASCEANRADYHSLMHITVYETAKALTVALIIRFDGLGFKQPVTCVLAYGDGDACFGGAQGRQYSISTDALDALGEALRQDRQWPLQAFDEPAVREPQTLH